MPTAPDGSTTKPVEFHVLNNTAFIHEQPVINQPFHVGQGLWHGYTYPDAVGDGINAV
jgi:hypothetical protein